MDFNQIRFRKLVSDKFSNIHSFAFGLQTFCRDVFQLKLDIAASFMYYTVKDKGK